MNNVTHAAIHHDPEGRCNWLLRKHSGDLREMFLDGFVAISSETANNRGAVNLLKKSGFQIIVRRGSREPQLDTGRHIAVLGALKRGRGRDIFFGCLDRTLHWLEYYPAELNHIFMGRTTIYEGYIALGRTERAFKTHPPVQQEPEVYTNRVTAQFLGFKDIDVVTGCALMDRRTAEQILRFLCDRHKFTNPEIDIDDSLWPMIAKVKGCKIGFRQTEGLEFETPDQYRKEIAEMGHEAWVSANFNEANFARRWERAYQTKTRLEALAAEFGLIGQERLG